VTRVRWTADAADDLARIVERIREGNPEAARRVAETIYHGVASLRNLPNRGRHGLAENTRELVFAPWPYIAVYEVTANQDQVHVLRIRHTSKDWP
jgi:toxin ParE1/3/4